MLGQIVLGRYEIVRFIGHGSMGQVWLAQDHAAPRTAVVKFMNPRAAAEPRFRELFRREMQFMAQFRHPHAVEFYDSALDDPAGPCIAMEYIPGVGLDEVLRKRRLLLPEQVGPLLTQLCQALNAAHTSGIIHRDLKPANLMVIRPGEPAETMKVMDLGLAQFVTKPHISLAKLQGGGNDYAAGTPAYICPEQLRGDPTDHRGDIYSLGVVLYELLTGRLPFDYEDTVDLLQAHVHEPPPTFREIGMGILPPRVEAVVLACLAKYPVERPQSAYDLACRFQAALLRPDKLDQRPFRPTAVASRDPEPVPRPAAPGADGDGERIIEKLEAWMPEPIAVVKLRGFVADVGGRIVASEPGLIRVRLGEPEPEPARPKSAIFGVFRKSIPPGPSPIPPLAIDLYLTQKASRGLTQLDLTIVFRAVDGPLPVDRRWYRRCDLLLSRLKAYLMADQGSVAPSSKGAVP